MARQNLTPEDFGLKVRQDPGALIVTARNKMRSGTPVSVPITLSGRMIETPRLWNKSETIQENNLLCEQIIRAADELECVEREFDPNVKAMIWRNVPKRIIVDLVRQYKSHPWNLNFQASALSDFIEEDDGLALWDLAIPYGTVQEGYSLELSDGQTLEIHAEPRKISKENTFSNMLRVNDRHVRVGAGGCAKIGLLKEQIADLRKSGKATDKTYLISGRKPIALIHLMYNTNPDLRSIPPYIYAIGLGFPGGKEERKANYIINTVELRNYVDIDDLADEDDDVL